MQIFQFKILPHFTEHTHVQHWCHLYSCSVWIHEYYCIHRQDRATFNHAVCQWAASSHRERGSKLKSRGLSMSCTICDMFTNFPFCKLSHPLWDSHVYSLTRIRVYTLTSLCTNWRCSRCIFGIVTLRRICVPDRCFTSFRNNVLLYNQVSVNKHSETIYTSQLSDVSPHSQDC